jgi:hypothetical protein
MLTHDENVKAFGALFPELQEPELETAYESFRRYVQLAIEVALATAAEQQSRDLTDPGSGGTVFAGTVDPTRTFTKTG